jgi:hypothetical protein
MIHGKLFAPVMSLWARAGIRPPKGHPASVGLFFHEIEPVLNQLGAKTVRQPVSTVRDAIAAAERNPNAVVLFGVEYKAGGAHAMAASAMEGQPIIYDTAGQVYRSWADLLRAHPNIRVHPEMLMVKGATLMRGLDIVAHGGDLMHVLAFEVKYLPLVTPITIQAAHKYVEEVALKGPMKKPEEFKERPLMPRTSDKPQPSGQTIPQEPGWRDPGPEPPDFPLR